MNVSTKLIEMLKKYEGLAEKRPDGKIQAYYDKAGKKWTIGYGHTKTAKSGMVITTQQALELKRQDLEEFENCVSSVITVPLKQGQFDALVSFAYNVGCGKFKNTNVVKAINKGDWAVAMQQLAKWNRAGGKVLPGLVARRNEEVQFIREATDLAYFDIGNPLLNSPHSIVSILRSAFAV